MYGDHRQLDQIGCRPLHRRIDRGALRTLASGRVARPNVVEIEPAPENGFDVAQASCRFARAFHVIPYARVTLEIAFHVLLRGRALDAELRSKAECRHAVDQSEVDDFRVAALFAGNGHRIDSEDFRCSMPVHVFAGGECLQQSFVLGQMRHDAQLDLGIVRRDDDRAWRRYESLADAATFRGANRNVLQVRVVAREPTGHRDSLRVVRVHPSGPGVHHARQLVGVGGFQFGQAPILEYQLGQRMIQREFLQHVFIR